MNKEAIEALRNGLEESYWYSDDDEKAFEELFRKAQAWDKYKAHMESYIAGEINEEELVSDLESDYFESGGYDAKNDEVDYCTKCTVKPIVKEHMCEECYTEHCQWLRGLSAPKHDDDQWFMLYESKA